MMSKSNIKIISIFALFITIAACDDKQDPVQVFDGGSGGIVTYSSDIQPLLETHCLSCHSASVSGADRNGAPLDVNFDTYDETYALADKSNQRIQSGTMPPSGPLSDQEKEMFQEWIEDGKLEHAPVIQSIEGGSNEFTGYQSWPIIENSYYPASPSILDGAHQGNDPGFTRQVYANVQKEGDRFRPGSIFVMETFSSVNGVKEYSASGGVFAMVKRNDSFNPEGNGWEWFELDPKTLSIIERGGAAMMDGACNSCHREAINQPEGIDMVFNYPE